MKIVCLATSCRHWSTRVYDFNHSKDPRRCLSPLSRLRWKGWDWLDWLYGMSGTDYLLHGRAHFNIPQGRAKAESGKEAWASQQTRLQHGLNYDFKENVITPEWFFSIMLTENNYERLSFSCCRKAICYTHILPAFSSDLSPVQKASPILFCNLVVTVISVLEDHWIRRFTQS